MRYRALFALLLVAAVVVAVPAVTFLDRLCYERISLYPPLATAQAEARAEASEAVQAGGVGQTLRAAAASAQAGLIELALQGKRIIAYPGHIAAGLLLEARGCAAEPTGDQWLKAGMHAPAPWAAGWAASGLERVLGPERARAAVDQAIVELPWFAEPLGWVEEHLRTRSSAEGIESTATSASAGGVAAPAEPRLVRLP